MDADLILEGGGVKGIALVGAIKTLRDKGYVFRRVAGTSAGAIVGALVAAGMDTPSLLEVMKGLDYTKFEDENFLDHLGMVGKGASLLFDKGIFKGDYLHQWLDDLLTQLGKRTFGDLRVDDPDSSLPVDRAYSLVVMTSDISRGELVRLPWDYPRYGLSADDQLVADAVRASMSIPFFFQPVKMHDHETGSDSYFVDGGMLSNFPVDTFDRTDGKAPRWPTLGIKLSAKPPANQGARFPIRGTFDLARAMIGTMANFHDQMHIDDPCAQKRTIFVDTFHVQATDFHLSKEVREKLYDNGLAAADEFLGSWDFDDYKRSCSEVTV